MRNYPVVRCGRWGLACVIVLVLSMLAPRTRAATPEEVEKSLQRAKAFLYSHINAKGNWDKDDPGKAKWGTGRDQWGGHTALAVYALLVSGEDEKKEPRLAKAIDFLQSAEIDGIYALGMRAQVWLLLDHNQDDKAAAENRKYMKRDAELLLNAIYANHLTAKQVTNPTFNGLYHYGTGETGNWHNSPSQYGVLGMWACEQAGYEVPLKYWQIVEETWIHNQATNGGWSYHVPPSADPKDKHGLVSPSMTAAGIATLFITQDYLHGSDGINCSGNLTNRHIDQGLKYMTEHFQQAVADYYTLYGIERIGVASGLKYFGNIDWYETGADYLVHHQGPKGEWAGRWGAEPSTAFGMLFLARGRAPVVLNKLEYTLKGGEAHWNQRPRDCANLVRWVGRKGIERDLNWQIVNLTRPVSELHDSPILYITGNQGLDFTPEQEAKIKEFVNEGGIVLGNADCGTKAFSMSFKKLGNKLFPRYEFRELPETHPIYTIEQYPRAKMNPKPAVQGLSNGARELMLLVGESDPSKSWQLNNFMTQSAAFQIAADIILYAVDQKGLRVKGDTYIVADKGRAAQKTIKVVRLMAGDNPDPEPGGWHRLNNVMKNNDGIGLEISPAKLGEGKLAGAQVVHLTGTTKVTFDSAAEKELKEYVEGGGTLIVDAAGGSVPFADSIEQQFKTMFGNSAPVPASSPVFSGGGALPEIRFRRYCYNRLLGKLSVPRILGYTVNGRQAVLFSREDLTCALVGQPVDGILGYDPAAATPLMRAMLIHASGAHPSAVPAKPPPAKPAQPKTVAKPAQPKAGKGGK